MNDVNVFVDKLDVNNIRLIPISSLPAEVQYFFNVVPYAMLEEGDIIIDKYKKE